MKRVIYCIVVLSIDKIIIIAFALFIIRDLSFMPHTQNKFKIDNCNLFCFQSYLVCISVATNYLSDVLSFTILIVRTHTHTHNLFKYYAYAFVWLHCAYVRAPC